MEIIKKFEPIFGEWYAESFIGAGSFGRVYKIFRDDLGMRFYSALKYISIPADVSELKQLRSDGMDDQSISTYYTNLASDISSEIRLMDRLRGNTNIVGFEYSKILPKPGGIGYDIFIRMELLQSLTERMSESPLSVEETVRLGTDICSALVRCEKLNVIHRDIKPDNIFVSPEGDYKLGDFGIARQLEKTATFMSKKGTYNYMAPEVFKGEKYGAACDIYSLGLVMYRLLNRSRLPFLPAAPAPITPSDREAALTRRLRGDELPAPCGADPELSAIVLKACAYKPEDRYANAAEFRDALAEYHASDVKAAPVMDEPEEDRTIAATPVPAVGAAPARKEQPAVEEIITGKEVPAFEKQPAVQRIEPEEMGGCDHTVAAFGNGNPVQKKAAATESKPEPQKAPEPKPGMDQMKKCSFCGSLMRPGFDVCPQCGRTAGKKEEPAKPLSDSMERSAVGGKESGDKKARSLAVFASLLDASVILFALLYCINYMHSESLTDALFVHLFYFLVVITATIVSVIAVKRLSCRKDERNDLITEKTLSRRKKFLTIFSIVSAAFFALMAKDFFEMLTIFGFNHYSYLFVSITVLSASFVWAFSGIRGYKKLAKAKAYEEGSISFGAMPAEYSEKSTRTLIVLSAVMNALLFTGALLLCLGICDGYGYLFRNKLSEGLYYLLSYRGFVFLELFALTAAAVSLFAFVRLIRALNSKDTRLNANLLKRLKKVFIVGLIGFGFIAVFGTISFILAKAELGIGLGVFIYNAPLRALSYILLSGIFNVVICSMGLAKLKRYS